MVADDVAPGAWPVGPTATNDGTAGLARAGLEQLPEASTFTAVRNLLYAVEWWVFGGVRRVHLVALDTGREGRREGARGGRGRPGTFGPVNSALTRYRVMATVVGVLLIVLCLIGVPLANFDGSGMWGIFPGTARTCSRWARPRTTSAS